MHKNLPGLVAASVLAMISSSGAFAADHYKWCAQYSGGMGFENCGFTTREQCMADVGTAGFCRQNLFYSGSQPEERQDKATKPARKREPS